MQIQRQTMVVDTHVLGIGFGKWQIFLPLSAKMRESFGAESLSGTWFSVLRNAPHWFAARRYSEVLVNTAKSCVFSGGYCVKCLRRSGERDHCRVRWSIARPVLASEHAADSRQAPERSDTRV